jgi:hypothetical protein
MQPIFKRHPINNEEIHALVAYFEATAGETPAQPAVSRISFLLLGIFGAGAVIFGFDSIWKRRFHSVRRPLVDAPTPRTTRPTEVH